MQCKKSYVDNLEALKFLDFKFIENIIGIFN